MNTIRQIEENYAKFENDDRSWDVAFWQSKGGEAIFEATWDMICDYYLLKHNDDSKPRLQRTVEYFGKV